jgi:hypothetical protein
MKVARAHVLELFGMVLIRRGQRISRAAQSLAQTPFSVIRF